jgi:HAD superfamily hydrolase (TIGR01509 family)
MNDIRVIAFDCDGVLFDTKKANMTFYNRILNQFGMPDLTSKQFAYVQMHTIDASLRYLFDDESLCKSAHAYRKKMGYFPFIKLMEIEPDLKPLLKKLRPEYKTAIATNRTDTIGSVLAEHNLEGYFDLVVSARDVARPKPHPDLLMKILTHFEIEPSQAVYIGDSELDETASKAAGVLLIAYNNPCLSADFHIRSLKELEVILKDKTNDQQKDGSK